MDNWYVVIIQRDGDVEIKRMGPMSERKAEKAERGVNINLGHNRYYTDIIEGA